jgi:hypothetical protein
LLVVTFSPTWVLTFTHSGSTATIIRLPYTSALKEYKGDFLYRTTDFAIWTTVEVGVGITAGCIATLKPLMKSSVASLTTTRQSSGLPWSKATKSKSGNNHRGQPLDEPRPGLGKSATTTTITRGRVSSESDEDVFLDASVPSERWRRGRNRNVMTMVVGERAASQKAERGPDQTTNMGRCYSPGGDRESMLGDEEKGKPARVYERF